MPPPAMGADDAQSNGEGEGEEEEEVGVNLPSRTENSLSAAAKVANLSNSSQIIFWLEYSLT